MEQTIKINCPEGKKAVYNESTQTIDFVDIEPTKSKSWEEFCKNNPIKQGVEFYIKGTFVTSTAHYSETSSREKVFNQARGYLATKEDAEGILALIQLTRLHDEWIGDWRPNYLSDSEYKWCIEVIQNSIDINAYTYTQKLLTFPTSTMAKEFLNCFRHLINKAKKFI